MGRLWAFLGRLEAILGRLRTLLDGLGALLGRLGALLGLSWVVMGDTWGILSRLGSLFGRLGSLLAALGALLGRLGGPLGPSWPKKEETDRTRTGSAALSTGLMREGVVRTPQGRLRRAPRRPKNLSRQRPVSVTSCSGPKNAPRWLQYVSRWHRDGSKTLQDAPKRGPEGPWDDPRTCHGNGRFP